MKKEAKVIMLPTDDKTHICGRGSDGYLIYYKNLVSNDEFVHLKGQHLYIVDNSEIKEGDWFINLSINEIHQADKYASICHKPKDKHCKKIIVTTDKFLEIVSKGINPIYEKLPQPSNDFIKQYCEAGGIDKVMVEYDVKIVTKGTNEFDFYEEDIAVIKINPDNTINISPIKN